MAEDNKTVEQLQERLALLQKEQSFQDKLNSTEEERRKLQEEILKANQEINKAKLQSSDLTKEEYEALRSQNAVWEKQISNIQKKNDKIKANTAALEEQRKLQEDILDLVGSIGAKYENTLLDKIAESKVSIGELGEAFKKNFSIDRITGAAFDAVTESMAGTVLMAANARQEFAAATGAGGSFDAVITDVANSNAALGIGFAESAQAVQALHSNMSGFTSLSQETQNSLSATAAELTSLGISADETASQVDYTTRVMGLSAEQASEQALSMRTFAMNAGIAPAKMAKEFAAAGPKIAQYGKNADKVFKGLALQSKKLGIEMGELLSITQQFDTFEGAANAAGQLNSVLGGPFLDSMALLTAETEEQRVAMLQNSLQMAGKSFESMSKFERMAVANAAGISDMSVAARMFGGESQKMAAEHEMLGLTAEQVQERQEAAVSATKKLTAAGQALAVAVMPIVDALSKAASITAEFAQNNQRLIQVLAGGAAAIYAFRKAAKATSIVTGFVSAQEGESIGRKIILAAKNFLLGKSAEAAAEGNEKLNKSGKSAGGGMRNLGKSLGSLGMGLIKVALAVLAIGAGIGIAAAGLSLLVGSFTELLQVVIDNIAVMPEAILSIFGLAGAFLAFGAAVAVAGAGFLIFAIGFAIGVGIIAAMTPAAVLAAAAIGILSLAVGGLSASFGLLNLSFDSIADQVNDIVSGMRELTGEDGVKQFVTVVKSLDEDNVGNLGDLLDEADRLVTIQAKLAAIEAADSVSNAVNRLISFVAPDTSGTSERRKREIILQMNGREFGRAVVEALDDDMKLSLA